MIRVRSGTSHWWGQDQFLSCLHGRKPQDGVWPGVVWGIFSFVWLGNATPLTQFGWPWREAGMDELIIGCWSRWKMLILSGSRVISPSCWTFQHRTSKVEVHRMANYSIQREQGITWPASHDQWISPESEESCSRQCPAAPLNLVGEQSWESYPGEWAGVFQELEDFSK